MNWDGIISLLFFCIEAVLLINVLFFSRKNGSLWKGPLIIAILASYQLLEYIMCGLGLKYSFAAYIALSLLSFLPPLGLLFVMDLLNKRFKWDMFLLLPPVTMLLLYLFMVKDFAVVKCSVIYAVYNYPFGDVYGFFYYLPILVTIFLLFSGLKNGNSLLRKNSAILLAGYLTVSVPVITAFALHFSGSDFLLGMVESIMCKSALVLAVCYSFVILNITGFIKVEGNNS